MTAERILWMVALAIIVHILQGTGEGYYVNWRTRNNKPDMGHWVTLTMRGCYCASLSWACHPQGFWSFLGFFVMFAAFGAPAHRTMLNHIRSFSYRVRITDMGTDWYDSIWMGLAMGEERTAFWWASIIEVLLGLALLIVNLNNLPLP